MRWVVCAVVVVLGLAQSAHAADLDILRGAETVGPATYPRWSGFYFGGQASYSNTNADFSNSTQSLLAYSLRELVLEQQDNVSSYPVLGKASTNSTGYGGFVGYNTQWQDVVVGLEANYTHTSINATSTSSPIGRIVSAGAYDYSVNIDGSGTLSITDYGSLRARAGWIYSIFMPYGFAGLALGHANYAVTAQIAGQQSTTGTIPCDDTQVTTCVDYSYANSSVKNNVLLYGFSVGGGVDIALTQNIFVRGEFEYVQFAPFEKIVASISTVRVGAGLKF